MCADCDELPSPAYVLMKFILQVNERRVGPFCEFDIPQDGTSKVRSDLLCLNMTSVIF